MLHFLRLSGRANRYSLPATGTVPFGFSLLNHTFVSRSVSAVRNQTWSALTLLDSRVPTVPPCRVITNGRLARFRARAAADADAAAEEKPQPPPLLILPVLPLFPSLELGTRLELVAPSPSHTAPLEPLAVDPQPSPLLLLLPLRWGCGCWLLSWSLPYTPSSLMRAHDSVAPLDMYACVYVCVRMSACERECACMFMRGKEQRQVHECSIQSMLFGW